MAGPVRDPAEAFQQLEAIMLRQMLQSSGAFRAATSTPGAQLRADMFVETLADAVAKAGGLGIAKMLQHDLGGPAARDAAAAGAAAGTPRGVHGGAGVAPAATFSRSSGSPSAAHSVAPAGRGLVIDDLDDPNSEAPLPEDPEAGSIDDYQPGAALAPGGGVEITSPFGPRIHPITGDRGFHTGVDLRAPAGAPIRAAAAGIVTDAGRRGGYGNTVEIDHGNGTTTLYAHASTVLVAKGQQVVPGQTVALVGQTGHATGPHLHFEVRRNDHPVDPTRSPVLPPLVETAAPSAAARVPLSVARALNRYRERVEATGAGTRFGAGDGDKP